MYNIRPLLDHEFIRFAGIELAAYPAVSGTVLQAAERMKKQNEPENVTFYGVFNDNSMVGGFTLYDYKMNLHSKRINALGIGSIAVDLCRKKEKVAREIMRFYLYKARANNTPIALLYPFNPEFYKNMGFGFGTPLCQFRVKPKDLPAKLGKANVRQLYEEDARLITNFYNEHARSVNGMTEKAEEEFAAILKREQTRVFGCVIGGRLSAYLVSHFKKGDESFLVNDMVVTELLFDSNEGLYELLAFLNSQSDQLKSIILNTFDEDFIFALNDPRNQSQKLMFSVYHECCHKGIGLMYRITDVDILLGTIADLYRGWDFRIKLDVFDSFIPENEKSYYIDFASGTLLPEGGGYDVEVKIGIAELSSLAICAAGLKALVKYGLAEISDHGYLDKLDKAFSVSEKPVCLAYF